MKKPNIIKSILSFGSKALVVLVLMCCFGFTSFQGVTYYLTGSFYDFKKAAQEAEAEPETLEEEPVVEERNKDLENTLLFIDDQDGLREHIILSMLNKETNALDLILLPENAQIQVSNQILKQLKERLTGKSNSVELRDVERVFGEEKYDMITSILEEMSGLTISGWDHMTAKQAVHFLESVGKVNLSMKNRFSYRDSEGILHSLSSGDHSFSAKDAMAYMTYLDGTAAQESNRLERVDTYLQAFLSKLISKNKSSKIIETYKENIESSKKRKFDNLEEALKTSNTDFLTLRILQGSESGDTFVIDSQKAQLQLSTLIHQAAAYGQAGDKKKAEEKAEDKTEDTDEDSEDNYNDEEESGDSKNLSIELYNAAYVQGIASEWEYFLEDEGYHITIVDTYQEEGPISQTRIVLEKDGIGGDLLKYFPDADVKVGDIDTGGDIQIYIGTDHINVGAAQ